MLLKIPFLYSVQNYQSAFEFPNQQNVTLYTVWWIFFGWLSFFFFFWLEEGLHIKILSYIKKGRSNAWSEFGQRGRHARSQATPLHAWYIARCPVPAGVCRWTGSASHPAGALPFPGGEVE